MSREKPFTPKDGRRMEHAMLRITIIPQIGPNPMQLTRLMHRQPSRSAQPMMFSPLLRCALGIAGSIITSVAVAQQSQYSHGDPTVLEQEMLEFVNRARMNPAQEGVILDS